MSSVPTLSKPTATPSRFLDLRALAAVEHLRFTTRHRIEGAYSGRHESRQKGGAGEFVDYREYAPGEDLRRLDWKVLARTGKAYIRLFQEETNLLCTLALDASGSMSFGGEGSRGAAPPRSKLEYAQFLATALSHVITRGQDQVGLAILGDTLRNVIPPGGTPTHIAGVQEAIESLTTTAATRMAPAFRQLFERTNQRGVLLVISDFLMDDLDDVCAALRLFRHRGSEVVLLHLVHPDEEKLPAGSAFRLVGLEDEGRIDCTPDEIRAAYQERFRQHLEAVRLLALSNGCDYRRVSTTVSYLSILGGFLVERSG